MGEWTITLDFAPLFFSSMGGLFLWCLACGARGGRR
jgi:hypothetical protein